MRSDGRYEEETRKTSEQESEESPAESEELHLEQIHSLFKTAEQMKKQRWSI